jgi:hypothetical protein
LERKRANPQLQCPNSIASAIEKLQENSPLVNMVSIFSFSSTPIIKHEFQALAPLEIKILRIFSRNFRQEQQIVIKKQLIVVFALSFTIVLLLLLIVCLLTRKGQSNMKQNLIETSTGKHF